MTAKNYVDKLKVRSEVSQAIDELVDRVVSKDGDKITSIRLYGSVTKGSYRKGESDIDLLVISEHKKIYENILDIEVDVGLKYGVVFSVLFDTPEEVAEILNMGYPFMREVLEKGELLYECS
ncbi:MAG: nucleotidyltransferase domain-containing protein [bacterium]|nr:nucleotidyltransferase domain-containing protein [bacterium]